MPHQVALNKLVVYAYYIPTVRAQSLHFWQTKFRNVAKYRLCLVESISRATMLQKLVHKKQDLFIFLKPWIFKVYKMPKYDFTWPDLSCMYIHIIYYVDVFFFLLRLWLMWLVSVGCCNYKQQKVFIETITVLSCMYMLLYYSAWNQVCLLAYFLSSLLLCGNTGSNNAAQNGLRMRQTPRKLTKLVQLLLFFGSWPTGHKFTTVKALFCVAISK